MAWKFLNIGKANAEIERLEKALADEQAKTAALNKERDELKTAAEANDSEIARNAEATGKELIQAKADLATAKQSVSTLTTERDDAKAQLATVGKERDELKAKIADPKGAIQTAASAKAAEITGAQGQPPIATAPVATPAAKPAEASGLKGFDAVQAGIKTQIAPQIKKA